MRVRQPDRGQAQRAERRRTWSATGCASSRRAVSRPACSTSAWRCCAAARPGGGRCRAPTTAQIWEIKISRADPDHVAVSYRDVTERVHQQERISLRRVAGAAGRGAHGRATGAHRRAGGRQHPGRGVRGDRVAGAAVGRRRRPGRAASWTRIGSPSTTTPATSRRSSSGCDGLPLTHSYPATDVVRTGRPRYLSGRAEFDAAQAGEPDAGARRGPARLGVPADGLGRPGHRRPRHRLPRPARVRRGRARHPDGVQRPVRAGAAAGAAVRGAAVDRRRPAAGAAARRPARRCAAPGTPCGTCPGPTAPTSAATGTT